MRTLKPAICFFTAFLFLAVTCGAASSQSKPRARDLGVPFDGVPGPLNAITDVKGVEVGHTTLISGDGALKVGVGPVRTGVTAILPRGKRAPPDEEGYSWSLPIVAETWDGDLNDANGFHVKPEHVFQALDAASGGAVVEGNVGGGTGMTCNEFKGGIGTASRKLDAKFGGYTVGVLVQCNYGWRSQLRIAGVPVRREITENTTRDDDIGSIIVIVATDAPLIPTQLKRIARRVPLGLGRLGSFSGNGSGDLFIAFSTANPGISGAKGIPQLKMLQTTNLNPLFLATVQATEEAVVNAMVAAETMTGINNHTVTALPHDELREVLKKYNRLAK